MQCLRVGHLQGQCGWRDLSESRMVEYKDGAGRGRQTTRNTVGMAKSYKLLSSLTLQKTYNTDSVCLYMWGPVSRGVRTGKLSGGVGLEKPAGYGMKNRSLAGRGLK